MNRVFSLSLILTLIMAWPSAGAAAVDASPNLNSTSATPAGDTVMVKGNGFVIHWKEIDQVLATAKAQNPQAELPPDAAVHVAAQLIEIQLVLQKATSEEKAAGEQEAAGKVADILKTLGQTEFEHRLQATHMTADDLRLKFAQDSTAQTSLTRQLGITVTDEDAKKFFDANPGAYDQPVVARIREILLLTTTDFTDSAAPPLPAATIQTKHELIDKLHQRIHAGEDFATLAKQYNEDPVSKGNGDLLAFPKNEMAFGDLAFAMKPNQISEVITSDEGFRIFQLLEIIPAKKAVFADLDDRIKGMLVGKAKRERAPAYINQLKKEANVEILDSELKKGFADADAQAAENAKAQAAFAAKQAAAEAAAAAGTIPAKP